MTAEQLLEELILNTHIFIITSFAISFLLCLIIMPKSDEKIYVGFVLSAIIPLFSCILPSAVYIIYYGKIFALGEGELTAAAWAVGLFFLPSILLMFLCVVIFVRHRRSETKSYKVEASAALLIAAATAFWTSGFAEALRRVE